MSIWTSFRDALSTWFASLFNFVPNMPVAPITPPTPTPAPASNPGTTENPCNEPDEATMNGNFIGFKSFPTGAEAWAFADRQVGRIQTAGHVNSCSEGHGYWRAWVRGCSSRGCNPSPAVAIFGPTEWVNRNI